MPSARSTKYTVLRLRRGADKQGRPCQGRLVVLRRRDGLTDVWGQVDGRWRDAPDRIAAPVSHVEACLKDQYGAERLGTWVLRSRTNEPGYERAVKAVLGGEQASNGTA